MTDTPFDSSTRRAPLCITAHLAEDAADQAANIPGWSQQYEQVSAGAFRGRTDELRLAPLQIFHEYTSQATYQNCQPWRDSIWFGFSGAEHEQALWFNGRLVPAHTLLFSPARSDFTLRTPCAFGIYGVVVDLEHLTQRCAALFGHDLPKAWRAAGAVQLGAAQHARLCASLKGLLASAHTRGDRLAQPHLVDALTDEILVDLLAGTHASRALEPASRGSLRHRDQVRAAHTLALSQDDPVLSVEDLCQRLHMTRRTLQNCFQEVLGMSPLAFVRSVQLNAVRQALRDPAQEQQTIQEIAARWGFWNMSYLAYDYKRLFGESPSQTRQSMLSRAS